MNKLIIIICGLLLFTTQSVISQTNIGFLKDVSGMTVEFKTSTEFVGNPYLTKDWSDALITTADGKKYKDVPIKYDQIENVLYFKDPEGKVNKFSDPIKEFSLQNEGNKIFRQFGPGKFFYLVLYDGKTKFITRDAKYLKENREYNSATVTKKVLSSTKYYFVAEDGELNETKANKKAILATFPDKKADFEKYADSEKLDLSKLDDIIKLFAHFDL